MREKSKYPFDSHVLLNDRFLCAPSAVGIFQHCLKGCGRFEEKERPDMRNRKHFKKLLHSFKVPAANVRDKVNEVHLLPLQTLNQMIIAA